MSFSPRLLRRLAVSPSTLTMLNEISGVAASASVSAAARSRGASAFSAFKNSPNVAFAAAFAAFTQTNPNTQNSNTPDSSQSLPFELGSSSSAGSTAISILSHPLLGNLPVMLAESIARDSVLLAGSDLFTCLVDDL
ncbi:hypothetical protein BDR26DRAFT_894324 [Obelidium mucronatum]|nr:hypothetical protein BDR26DRAFT_894324 [Obelidium mucronatum]